MNLLKNCFKIFKDGPKNSLKIPKFSGTQNKSPCSVFLLFFFILN